VSICQTNALSLQMVQSFPSISTNCAKQSLLLGLDAIGTILQRAEQIRSSETRHLSENT
jgi:3-isopropylmalate dehydratase small subunit